MTNIIAVATNNNNTVEATQNVLNPQVESLTWVNLYTDREKTETRYEKKVGIRIETSDASKLYAFIIVNCKEWNKSYIDMMLIPDSIKKKGETKAKEYFLFTFTPKSNWAKDATKETEISATVYIISDSRTQWSRNTFLLMAEDITGKSGHNFRSDMSDGYINILGKKTSEKKTTVYNGDGCTSENIKLKEKKIVIVIDPGHGVTPGNVGTQARVYTYKLQDDEGKERKDDEGNVLTQSADVTQLPQYVIDDPETWIVGNNQVKDKKHTDSKNILDAQRTESLFAYDLSLIIIRKLRDKGYEVINTRTSRDVVQVTNSIEAIEFRRRITNNNEADYFISLHADGDESMGFASGGHVVYNVDDQDGAELAADLFSNYTILDINTTTREHPAPRNNVGVVGDKNKATRKALIEFGFMTSPKDARAMFTDLSREQMADQIISGLELNINRYFNQ